ncbi:MAG: hypothetical protein UR85_C0011G0024 [Candidatus Nomurabacteria bacterium GW2011_GWF2_35_66]|nr:MAG: hypothetical protein UR85_C0011G0024 [Candidatus Nomurabacteria bacterium GW2011_GWF2_35_66]HBM45430.1 hypothetical protein [Patescibacteria group bacterium]
MFLIKLLLLFCCLFFVLVFIRSSVIKTKRPILLVIVRHGESLRNELRNGNRYLNSEENSAIIKNVPDPKIPLTKLGKKQSLITGRVIREKFGYFDVVYDSGYLRTRETREEIMRAYSSEELAKTKIRSSHLIREREPGYAYNMTQEDVNKFFPYLDPYWKKYGPFYSRPPGGESQTDVCERVYRFIGMLFSQRAGKKVLVITHGGAMRAFRFNLEKWTAKDYEENFKSPENCAVTAYRLNEKNGRMELEILDEVFWTEEDLRR